MNIFERACFLIRMVLKGGLGNQLFQYALGRHLSLINNTKLLLDISSFKNDPLRSYRLGSFNLPHDVLISDDLNYLKNKVLNKIFKNCFSRLSFLRNENYILEKSFKFRPEILNCHHNSQLDGYWQSQKYFQEIASIIKTDLTLKNLVSPHLNHLVKQILCSKSVSLHIRRGDYATNPVTAAYHGMCPIEWYDQALQKILELEGDVSIFVFSDDIEWAKNNLIVPVNTTFIEPSASGKEAEDLYLMSLCKHNIIANSSFSWWAAWLNPNIEKIIIAPAKWFSGANHDTKDLIPSDWIQL
jgi:hypothetical protein